jgi:hypothetical protein
VIARFTQDPAWPRPVWGVKPATLFTVPEAKQEILRWRHAFNLPPTDEE